MKNGSIVGLLLFLGVASLAHAHASSTSVGKPTSTDLSRAPQRTSRPARSAQRLGGQIQCGLPQLVRGDQGIGAQPVPAEGGTFVLLMWMTSGCGATLSEDSDMLTDLTNTGAIPGGIGYRYTVLPNTGAARTAVITAKASYSPNTVTFTVQQAAKAATTPPPATTTPTLPDAAALGTSACGAIKGITLKSGSVMPAGTSFQSPNNTYQLIYQTDGNLVVYALSPTKKALWASGTQGVPPGKVIMQSDGNLVIYKPDGAAAWSTKTNGNTGAFLSMQDDNNLVVYRKDSCQAAWARR
ncbi:MAG: hypothetical protein QM778_11790 [Myxococcales bacterium]